MKCSDKEWQHCQKEKRGCEGCAYNDEIAVGDYVRTDKGKIAQIKEIRLGKHKSLDEIINIYIVDDEEWTTDKYIVKHSKDILDLIEDDDFIIITENGYPLQIREMWDNGGELNIRLSNEMIFEDIKNDKEFEIKSILTKEMFEANVYKLEEKLIDKIKDKKYRNKE